MLKFLSMKKFEKLGKPLSKEEQRKILGGDPPGGGQCGSTGCRPLTTDCPSSCPCTLDTLGYKCVTPP